MIRQTLDDRIRRLETALADFTAKWGPDAPLTRQVARNLANAHAAREQQDDRGPGDDQPEAA